MSEFPALPILYYSPPCFSARHTEYVISHPMLQSTLWNIYLIQCNSPPCVTARPNVITHPMLQSTLCYSPPILYVIGLPMYIIIAHPMLYGPPYPMLCSPPYAMLCNCTMLQLTLRNLMYQAMLLYITVDITLCYSRVEQNENLLRRITGGENGSTEYTFQAFDINVKLNLQVCQRYYYQSQDTVL